MAFLSLFRNNRSNPSLHDETEEEVDGFVLIGETTDEKRTVKPGDAVNKEQPPCYNDLQIGTSSSGIINNGIHSGISKTSQNTKTFQPSSSASTTQEYEPHCTQQPHKKETKVGVHDIPFTFAPSISSSLNHGQLTRDLGDTMPNIWRTLSEYDYNFEVEYCVLDY